MAKVFRFIEGATKFAGGCAKWSVLVVAGVWLYELKFERPAQDHEARTKESWAVIYSTEGKSGDGGRQKALEFLIGEKANLAYTDLSRISLEGAQLEEARLQRIKMNEAYIENTSFRNADLSFATLRESQIRGSTFANSDLSDTDFTQALLVEVDFSNTLIEQANFEGVTLEDADFSGAEIIDSNFRGFRIVEVRGFSNQFSDRFQKKPRADLDAPKAVVFRDATFRRVVFDPSDPLNQLTTEQRKRVIIQDAAGIQYKIESTHDEHGLRNHKSGWVVAEPKTK